MDHQRHAALTDETLERDIARALAIDPSPDFVARVRTRIANQPERGLFAALKGGATFEMWRRAALARRSALSAKAAALHLIVGGAVVAAIVLAAVLARPDRAPAPVSQIVLAARLLDEALVVPYVGSGFGRISKQYVVSGFSRTLAAGPPEGGHYVRSSVGDPQFALPQPLLDPRETQALRALLAGVRENRVDLSPLLRPGAPAPMELPPVDDLVIAPLAIEPLAPIAGAQGERQ